MKMKLPSKVWMHMMHKLKGALKHEERKVNRKGVFYALEFSLVPTNHRVHVEMLGVRIKAHMEAISSLFGLNIGVGFNKKSCLQREGARVYTFVTHGEMERRLGR